MSISHQEITLQRLTQEFNLHLSHSQEQLLRSFFNNIPHSTQWTMKKLSTHANVSMASISRLISKLKMHGYKEMLLMLNTLHQQTQETILLQNQSPVNQQLAEIYRITYSNLTHFHQQLKQHNINTLIETLRSSNLTLILSVGFSQFAGDYLAYSLQMRGFNIQSISLSMPSELYWLLLKKCNLVVVISRSANTPSLYKKIEQARAFNLPILLITGNPKGHYAKIAQYLLPIYDRDPSPSTQAYSGFQLKLFHLIDIISTLL